MLNFTDVSQAAPQKNFSFQRSHFPGWAPYAEFQPATLEVGTRDMTAASMWKRQHVHGSTAFFMLALESVVTNYTGWYQWWSCNVTWRNVGSLWRSQIIRIMLRTKHQIHQTCSFLVLITLYPIKVNEIKSCFTHLTIISPELQNYLNWWGRWAFSGWSLNGNLPQVGVNVKNIWNHHLGDFLFRLCLSATTSITSCLAASPAATRFTSRLAAKTCKQRGLGLFFPLWLGL